MGVGLCRGSTLTPFLIPEMMGEWTNKVLQKSSCSIFADDLEVSGENRRQLEESGMKACSEEESNETVDVRNRGRKVEQ